MCLCIFLKSVTAAVRSFLPCRLPEAAVGAVCQEAGGSCQSSEDGAALRTDPCSP